MGLGDIYTSDFASNLVNGPNNQISDAFRRAPDLEASYLHAQGQRQANTDAAYNSPAREANSQEQQLGEYYKKMIGHGDPNVPPEWSTRLHAELTGGQAQPSGLGGQSQGQGPIQNMGSGGAPQAPAGINGSAPASMGGYGLSGEAPERTVQVDVPRGFEDRPQDPTGGQPLPEPPRGLGMAPMRSPKSSVQESKPMTRGDVQMWSQAGQHKIQAKAAPRDYIAEENNREANREKLAPIKEGAKTANQTQAERNRTAIADADRKNDWRKAWQRHLDTLEEIKARVKIGASTAFDIAKLKALVDLTNSARSGSSKDRASLNELMDDPETQQAATDLETEAKQTLIEAEKQMQKMGSGPATVTGSSSETQTIGNKDKAKTQAKALEWARKNPNDPRAQTYLAGQGKK